MFASDFMVYACVAVPLKIGAGTLSHLALDSLVPVIIPNSEFGTFQTQLKQKQNLCPKNEMCVKVLLIEM